MSRQRDHDLDEDFEVSIGLSDIEKEDEAVIGALSKDFKKIEIKKPKYGLKREINLRYRKPLPTTTTKCRISFTSSQLLPSILPVAPSQRL